MSEEQKAAIEATLREHPLDLTLDVGALRAAFEQVMQSIPLAPDVQTSETTLGGVGAIEVTIEGIAPTNVLLYFHGGVYTIGSARTSLGLAADLARRSGAKVVTVDYRLAPEHPFPAAVDDATAAYQGLLSLGVAPGTIAVSGDSAGGGLAAGLLMALRDAVLPLPSSAFLLSPMTDMTLSGKSVGERGPLDPTLSVTGVRPRIADYIAGSDPRHPYASPAFGDLRGLPPILIQVGTHEILLSDAVMLAERAAESEVAVILDVTPGVPHVFQAYAAVLEEGDRALKRAVEFLLAHYSMRSGS